MKVVIFGASGIIGQHMRLSLPEGVTARWMRRFADPIHDGLDLTDTAALEAFLGFERPDVIVNLAGESNTDVVERDPTRYDYLNAVVPRELAEWCNDNRSHLIQVSTQAVFGGMEPPYGPSDYAVPVNFYGAQKWTAESSIQRYKSWTIIRPTFVLGIRPLQFVGRGNPMEQFLSDRAQRQVCDRWFSPSFAVDVAAALWREAISPRGGIQHVGIPLRTSRYELANRVAGGVEKVSHDDFPGIAPRPIDTTYADTANTNSMSPENELTAGLMACARDLIDRDEITLRQRAREIALFLGKSEQFCLHRLNLGFGALHNQVAEDWRQANPRNDWEILNWYGRTDAYIWELSAYHAHPGFNYSGMCQGIAERLRADGSKKVLCLGDGIGDLTLSLIRAGFDATYHDLAGSRTAEFAQFRFWMYLGKYAPTCLTRNWEPEIGFEEYDAIVSLDFLEHVTDVPAWTSSIKSALKPGGLFCAQNAFNCGSGPDGSIPMHLERNVRFEKDWDPMLIEQGFSQIETSNWYRVPAEVEVKLAA